MLSNCKVEVEEVYCHKREQHPNQELTSDRKSSSDQRVAHSLPEGRTARREQGNRFAVRLEPQARRKSRESDTCVITLWQICRTPEVFTPLYKRKNVCFVMTGAWTS